MRLKVIIKYILLILWMILIFWFSNQNATESTDMSDGFIMQFFSFLENIMGIYIDEDKIISLVFLPIRKLAHFSLYFVLGFLWMSLFKEYSIDLSKQFIYSLLFCLIYACSDEIHQLFIPGRSGNIVDVIIDTIGSLSSVISIYLFRKYKKKTV